MSEDKGGMDKIHLLDEVKTSYAHKLKTLLVAVLATFKSFGSFKQQAGSEN